MSYAIDFEQYMESIRIKPLMQGAIVEHDGERYTVDRWIRDSEFHCYVFVPNKGSKHKPFAKRPMEVVELLYFKTIKIISLWPLPQPSTGK